MKTTDKKCCICEQPAVVRSFDGTGWCDHHQHNWYHFEACHHPDHPSLIATFRAWLMQAKTAHNTIVGPLHEAIEQANDFYATAERFAVANDDWWAAIKPDQLEDITALYNTRENAAQALTLQLRTRRIS